MESLQLLAAQDRPFDRAAVRVELLTDLLLDALDALDSLGGGDGFGVAAGFEIHQFVQHALEGSREAFDG